MLCSAVLGVEHTGTALPSLYTSRKFISLAGCKVGSYYISQCRAILRYFKTSTEEVGHLLTLKRLPDFCASRCTFEHFKRNKTSCKTWCPDRDEAG
jgi:hypothetical protein